MSYTFCIRPEHHKLVRESKVKNKEYLRLLGSGLPGVKSAPVRRRKMRSVDWDFQERKVGLARLLPTYTLKDVQRLGHPYHILIIHTLLENGYTPVVEELNQILRKEENEMITCRNFNSQPLLSQKDLFISISETLKFCTDLIEAKRIEHSVKLRVELAIEIMHQKGNWLARHLLQIALKLTDQIESENEKRRFKAEIFCLLAFLSRSTNDLPDDFDLGKIQESLNYLTECRELSQGEPWHFQPHVIIINIRKAIDIHGLRKEETYIDGNSMPLYMFASLLEHEVLIKLANQMLLKQADLADEDVQLAIQYAEDALELALEVREPESMSSTLFRFGEVLRDSGANEEAMDFFDQLQMHAEIKNDRESEAIGFQGLGSCFNEKREPVNALEMFTLEYETAGQHQLPMGKFIPKIIDIQADALKEIGHVLLTEGQTLESLCSFFLSNHDFLKAEKMYQTPESWLDTSWSLLGLSQGQSVWGRLAGLARQNTARELKSMIKFKNERAPLSRVKRPQYNMKLIQSEWGQESDPSSNSSDAEDNTSHVDHPHFHIQKHKKPKSKPKSTPQQQEKHDEKHEKHGSKHHHHEEDEMSEVSRMSEIFISKVWSKAEVEERKTRDKFSFTIEGWFRNVKKGRASEGSSKSYKKSDASKQKGNLRESRFTDSESLFTMSSDVGSSPFDADFPYESDRGRKGSKSTLSHSSSSPSDQTSTSGKKSVSISVTEDELRHANSHHSHSHSHSHHHNHHHQHQHHHHHHGHEHHLHFHHHGHAISTLAHSHINSYMSQTSQNSRVFINKLPSYMQGTYDRSFSENIKPQKRKQSHRRQMSPGQIHLSHQQMTFDPEYDTESSRSKRTDTASSRSSTKSSVQSERLSSLRRKET